MNELPKKPDIRVAGNISLTPEVETVLRAMFSGFSQIAVEAEFGRGFSGSRTFRVRLVEAGGRAQLPAAIKIAPIGLIQAEWQAYRDQVEHILPNIARLEAAPICPAGCLWGGLRYTLVGGGAFAVQSLHDYAREASLDDLCWTLENRLFEIMGPNWWFDNRVNRTFQMRSDYDILLPVNLFIKITDLPAEGQAQLIEAANQVSRPAFAVGDAVQLKGFTITKVDSRRRQLTLNLPAKAEEEMPESYRLRLDEVPAINNYQVGQIIGSIYGVVAATRQDLLIKEVQEALAGAIDLSAERLSLPGDLAAALPHLRLDSLPASLPNPLLTYQALLHQFLTVKISTIHGDLNLDNILIDPDTREVSLIDFATVRRGHVLHDLLRLETEVIVTLIPSILAETGLPPAAICLFYQQLHAAIFSADQITALKLPHADFEKPFEMVRVIRGMAHKCLFNLDDWREYYQGLVIYLLGALKFKSPKALTTPALSKQAAFWAAAMVQHLLDLPPARPRRRSLPNQPPIATLQPKPSAEIEPPLGTMRPDSRFYIERPADAHSWQQITAPHAATLFVQAPMQMGKSSLMRRVIHLARKTKRQQFAFIDFQKFTDEYFAHEEKFFIELCLMIGDALSVPEAVDQYWAGRRTNIIKCSLYMSEHVIPRVAGPLILAMDEVERMLTCPFRANFFGMLRTWHNDRVYNENFARMTLFLSSSTDPYLLIDNPHQSPFNVATLISLQDFTLAETEELNRRHNSPLTQAEIGDLMNLLSGHPFLTRLALYQVTLGKIDMPALLNQATEDTGPFGEHLRHYLLRVLAQPELKRALGQIAQRQTYEENHIFHRLKEAGLIKKVGRRVVFRNNLYDHYFKERLNG
jgi:serine/threonine protein kinase